MEKIKVKMRATIIRKLDNMLFEKTSKSTTMEVRGKLYHEAPGNNNGLYDTFDGQILTLGIKYNGVSK